MEVLLDTRNEKYYIITLKGNNQIKINKSVNPLDKTIQWLKSMNASEIIIISEEGREVYE